MIVWLNGPFGVGKSTCVAELVRQDRAVRVHDPERLGWWLQRTVGVLRRGDYQELRSWRRGTVRTAARRARGTDLLVVPMSVLEPLRVDELLGGLAAREPVRHVTLHASPAVLRARIDADVHDEGARDWRRRGADRYAAVADELAARGPVVVTDGLAPAQVAAAVLAAVGH
jgi:hypothetical protein